MSNIGVEYFSNSIESAVPADRENVVDRYVTIAKSCGVRHATSARYLDRHGQRLWQELYSDFSSVTINRAPAISLLVDEFIAKQGGAQDYWDQVATDIEARSPASARATLELAVERRNEIAHYGDYRRFSGQAPIDSTHVHAAYRLIESLVRNVETYFAEE